MGNLSSPDPYLIILVLVSLSLAPFLAMMVTSFIKFVVVISLVRNALGIQQIPPNMVINGLALILTIYVMAPVYMDALEPFKTKNVSFKDTEGMVAMFNEGKEPFRQFLLKHSNKSERQFFMKSAKALWSTERYRDLKDDDFFVLIPSFTVSELTAAFQIGFLLYLPFVAIDLIISNILLAMGMMMVSPMTISLPFKLLLFVMLDGWARLIHGMVLTYV